MSTTESVPSSMADSFIPSPPSQAPAFGHPTSNEEVSTLFVVGFPDDMQEREFQNMFTFSPGFEAATLKVPSKDTEEDMYQAKKQTIGFAKFRTRLQALEARDVLSGRKVDAEKGSLLKAEMAKKNLHTKRGLSNEPVHIQRKFSQFAYYSISKGTEEDLFSPVLPPDSFASRATESGMDHQYRPPVSSSARLPIPFRPQRYSRMLEDQSKPTPLDLPPSYSSPPIANRFPVSKARFGVGMDQNPPCNTLYVGNLPSNISEEDLTTLFSKCEGYKRLSFRNKPSGPMCFVEFEQVHYATQALSSLQGSPLGNSVKGGIRLSFSKNPLGVRHPTPSHSMELQLSSSHLANSHA